MQDEIRFFPFFSWYPQGLKIRIMSWAIKKAPSLVGHTEAPAINWFTPWKANRMLIKAGFHEIYGTWDLIRDEEFGNTKKKILRVIRAHYSVRVAAEVFVPAFMCLAIKKRSYTANAINNFNHSG